MIIRDKHDGSVVAEIVTNRSMTIDEAMELAGYPWSEDDNDSGYRVGDTYYDADDLELQG